MTMSQQEYPLQELANLLGISPRTIRYYTQEGLLPEPISQGRNAVYTEEHLERLKLILKLKETYLPLKEIRQAMTSLAWPEVRKLLEEHEQENRPKNHSEVESLPPAREARSISEPESALDYITRLLKRQPELRSPEARRLTSFVTTQANEIQAGTAGQPPESWRRIRLAPGVELHIKEPYTSSDPQRFEELIQFAQKLFSKERK
jgi:DNA-binding transcriptional MerR regulator